MPVKTSIEKENKIIQRYKLGDGVCEIAKNFALYRGTILQILNRNGIKTERITRPYKNKYNINFFCKYNNVSAYWAGFIFADGYIHNRGQSVLKIALKESDTEHLKKFSKAIGFTGPVHSYKYNGCGCCIIYVGGKWFSKDLFEKYNITNKKSLTITFPNQIPEKYLPHFVRGIFDGDGSITKGNSMILNITGNIKVISKLKNLFFELLKIKDNSFAPLQINKKNKKICQVSFSAEKAKIILDWLYKDSDVNTRLNRKYKKYLEYSERYA